MLLDLETLANRYAMNVTGVVHCGAHLAEEAPLYARLFPGAPVVWVEANPQVLPKIRKVLRRHPGQVLLEGLLWSEDGIDLPFNVTNYDGMSSSILPFGTHPQFSPDTVFVDKIALPSVTLDTLLESFWAPDAPVEARGLDIRQVNLLNMDLQGVELRCLEGAERLLNQIDYINSEVNTDEVYLGCTRLEQLDEYLDERGFTRVETSIVPGQGWGDGMWVRR
jgi:FkbM family methyltransferase